MESIPVLLYMLITRIILGEGLTQGLDDTSWTAVKNIQSTSWTAVKIFNQLYWK